MKTVFDKLRTMLSEEFGFAERDLLPQTTLESLGFNNHIKINFFLDTEAVFEVRFSDSDIDSVSTIDQFAQCIERKRFEATAVESFA